VTPCSCHTALELGHHQIHRQSWIISARAAYTQEMANTWTRETIEPGRVSNHADPLIKQKGRAQYPNEKTRVLDEKRPLQQGQQIQHFSTITIRFIL
jgi:hypothetical protein